MSFLIDDILKKENRFHSHGVSDTILHNALICAKSNQPNYIWKKEDHDVFKSLEEKYYLHYRNVIYGSKAYVPENISNSYKLLNMYTHSLQFPYHIKFTTCKRKGGQIRFSTLQTEVLEKRFNSHKYLSPEERKLLANTLNLSDRQVKTWFQNRRAKWRRLHNQAIMMDKLSKEDGASYSSQRNDKKHCINQYNSNSSEVKMVK